MRGSNQFAESATGVVYIHSSPVALCPHVEWALADVLPAPVDLRWSPTLDDQVGAAVDWIGPVGTAAALAAALRPWSLLRFEVTEDPSEGVDGMRYSHVPGLGLWQGTTNAVGDVVVGEQRLRAILAGGGDVGGEIRRALGTAWDEALEPFRLGGEGAQITWLHRYVS